MRVHNGFAQQTGNAVPLGNFRESGSRAPATSALESDRRCPFHPGINQSDRPRSIAVIGAGISGLVCAWLLKQAGHGVRIIEASHRVGGRIKTLRAPFSRGLHTEAGAMRIPDHHRLTLKLANLFGLELVPFLNSCGNALVHLDGRRHTWDQLPGDARSLGFPVEPQERGRTARNLFEAAVIGFLRRTGGLDSCEPSLFDAATAYSIAARDLSQRLDRLSLGTFLREASDLSPGAANYVLTLLSLEAHQTSSMAAIVGDHRELTASEAFWQVRGGMDALTHAFLLDPAEESASCAIRPDLMGDVIHGARVVELVDDTGAVRVCVEGVAGAQRRALGPFDRVVLSAPFSALRHVRFNGLASPAKNRAMRCLHYDSSCKILLEFDHPFWLGRTGEPIRGGRTVTDRPVRSIHYPTLPADGQLPDRAILLASYTWADDSLRWISLRPGDRIRFALRDLEHVHGLPPGSLDGSCAMGTSHSWIEQEFASGAVAMFGPHQLTTLFHDVRGSEGRLHYCGEHTSERHGWIEGAIESALRAATEVCGAIDDEVVRCRRRAASADQVAL